jgi:hypothetical protein
MAMTAAAAATEKTDATEVMNAIPLLDHLRARLGLRSDSALAGALRVAPPVISKIRHHRLPVGASLLIRMHEETGMEIKELRALMGDRRKHFRTASISDVGEA